MNVTYMQWSEPNFHGRIGTGRYIIVSFWCNWWNLTLVTLNAVSLVYEHVGVPWDDFLGWTSSRTEYGLSPMWVRWCCVRSLWERKLLPHLPQSYVLSPVWTRWCTTRRGFEGKPSPHKSQWYSFFSVSVSFVEDFFLKQKTCNSVDNCMVALLCENFCAPQVVPKYWKSFHTLHTEKVFDLCVSAGVESSWTSR